MPAATATGDMRLVTYQALSRPFAGRFVAVLSPLRNHYVAHTYVLATIRLPFVHPLCPRTGTDGATVKSHDGFCVN
jgi:hypothetical protein